MACSDRGSIMRQRQEAVAMLGAGSYKEAEPCLRDAVEQTLEQKNSETFMWEQRLAECLLGQGKFTEAESYAQKALNGFRKFGPEDEDVLDCKYLMAECLIGQRKHSEAGDLVKSALQGLEGNMKRGAEHPTTLKCRGLMAITLKAQHKFVEAGELAKSNLASVEAVVAKAEAIEASGSRKLTVFERKALQKAGSFSAQVLGADLKPKRTSTIETVSTNTPADSDGEQSSRFSSQQNSRVPSKELPL